MSSSISAISNAFVKRTLPVHYSYNTTTKTSPSLFMSQSVALTKGKPWSHSVLVLPHFPTPMMPQISTSLQTNSGRSCSTPSEGIDDPPPYYSPEPKPEIEFPEPPTKPPLGPDIPLPKPDIVPPRTPPSPDVIPPPPPDKVPERPPGPEIFPPPTMPTEIVPPEIPTRDSQPPPPWTCMGYLI